MLGLGLDQAADAGEENRLLQVVVEIVVALVVAELSAHAEIFPKWVEDGRRASQAGGSFSDGIGVDLDTGQEVFLDCVTVRRRVRAKALGVFLDLLHGIGIGSEEFVLTTVTDQISTGGLFSNRIAIAVDDVDVFARVEFFDSDGDGHGWIPKMHISIIS